MYDIFNELIIDFFKSLNSEFIVRNLVFGTEMKEKLRDTVSLTAQGPCLPSKTTCSHLSLSVCSSLGPSLLPSPSLIKEKEEIKNTEVSLPFYTTYWGITITKHTFQHSVFCFLWEIWSATSSELIYLLLSMMEATEWKTPQERRGMMNKIKPSFLEEEDNPKLPSS